MMVNRFADIDAPSKNSNRFEDLDAGPSEEPTVSRSFGQSVSQRAGEGWKSLTSPVGDRQSATPEKGESGGDFIRRSMRKDVDEGIQALLNMLGGGMDILTSPTAATGESIERKAALAAGVNPKAAEKLARDTGDVTKMIPFIPVAKNIPKAVGVGGDAIRGVRESINTKADTLGKRVPIDKENAQIIKILTKDGHSPEDIVNIVKKAKENGMTVGEASGNPKLMGLERKISGLNQPGGLTVRDFVKDRVDPNNNVSMPYKLKSIADPLVKTVDEASKQIGKIVESAPKTPISFTSIESLLAKEARPPKSTVTNTLDRIDGLLYWAKSQGGTFADYHRVKQEIYNLGSEARDPSAVEKLDSKTVSKYYKKVNDVLAGKTPGLPQDLQDTARAYRTANETFSKNLAGRTIQETLDKMPIGGTPASKLKYLHKQLAGNAELQEELFSGMPEAQRPGMIKLLKAIEESSRSGATDVVKSMEEGSPTFPFSKSSALHKMFNAVADALTRKDYDALAKALTSPDATLVAKRLGYVEPIIPQKPTLRLTYQPKSPEVDVNREGEARLIPRHEQALIDQTRGRLENLGIRTDHFRVQDMNTVRELEKKYGQSELGKFVIANRHTPFIDKAWQIPQKEYSQATVNRMMRDSAWNKLDEAQQHQINSEIEEAWNSHRVTLADMVLSAREAAQELASITGGKPKIGSVGEALFNSINTGTPLGQVIPQIKP